MNCVESRKGGGPIDPPPPSPTRLRVTIFSRRLLGLRANAIKAWIEKKDLSPLCKMCGAKDETTHLLGCGCSKLAQIEYKQRRDNVARIVRWNLAKLHRLDVAEKWYDHKSEGVMESHGTPLRLQHPDG